MIYAIGQKVRYKPHHPGDVWATEPWYIYAWNERHSLFLDGPMVTYEVTLLTADGAVEDLGRIDCFVRPDMLEPWKEENV